MPPFSFMFLCENTTEFEIRQIFSNLNLGILHKIELMPAVKGQMAIVHYANMTNTSFIHELNVIQDRLTHNKIVYPKRIPVKDGVYWHVYKLK